MTGLIYAAIIAMWAVVLVPMWLRGHDRASETRSIDRFEGAMRTLRRGPSLARRNARSQQTVAAGSGIAESRSDEVGPANRSRTSTTRVDDAERDFISDFAPVGSPQARLRSASVARQRAASRRRIVLMFLGAGLLVVAGMVLTHRLQPISLAIPGVLLLGFVVLARRQVRLADLSRRRLERSLALGSQARDSSSRRTSSTRTAASRSSRSARHQASRLQAHLDSLGEDAPIDIDDVEFDSDAWEAVPTTLPTYVTAPRATRVPRVIDLTTPGSWNGQAMVDQAYAAETVAPQASSAIYDQIDDGVWDDVDASVSRRAAESFSDRYVEDDHRVDVAVDEEFEARFVRRAVND